MSPSRARPERPAPVMALNTTTLTISALGFVSAGISGNLSYRKGLSASKASTDLPYDSILDCAKRQSVIVFDTEEGNERAWLVPQLSLILELVNKWAYDQGFRDLNFAEPSSHGGRSSKTVLKQREYANQVIRESSLTGEPDRRVADLVKDIYAQMCLRASMDAADPAGARGTKELSREGLLGWDLLELSNPIMVPKRRESNISRTHLSYDLSVRPSWLPLSKHLPTYFGRRLGELIAPLDKELTCKTWRPVPGGIIYNHLTATVRCILEISRNNGFDDCCQLLDDLVWDYDGESVFEDCSECLEHKSPACPKKAQVLVKPRDRKNSPRRLDVNGTFEPRIPKRGAVIFTNSPTLNLRILHIMQA